MDLANLAQLPPRIVCGIFHHAAERYVTAHITIGNKTGAGRI
jgi:hypothetical protein